MTIVDNGEPIAGYASMREAIDDLYVKEGLSMKQVCERLDISMFVLARRMEDLDIDRRPRGGATNPGRILWTLHRLNQIDLMAEGNETIARTLDCSLSLVYKFKKGLTAVWDNPSPREVYK